MSTQAQRWITIPNVLTLTRILLTPCVMFSITAGAWGVASILFFVGALSDCLDGFIARSYQQHTFLGACLDPIADKFFVIASFYALSVSPYSFVLVPSWFIGLMLIKELFLVLGVLYFCFGSENRIMVCPSLYGKTAACAQMISLYGILIVSYTRMSLCIMGDYLFIALALTMVIALLDYFYRAIYAYKKGKV